jgi:hypothetical protein
MVDSFLAARGQEGQTKKFHFPIYYERLEPEEAFMVFSFLESQAERNLHLEAAEHQPKKDPASTLLP